MTQTSFAGRSVLVVEDEYFIATDLKQLLEAGGARVVGPAASVDDALDLLDRNESLDGAILDLNLQGEFAYPVADALILRGVPLVFATGYDKDSLPERYAHVTRHEKPVDPADIARSLFD